MGGSGARRRRSGRGSRWGSSLDRDADDPCIFAMPTFDVPSGSVGWERLQSVVLKLDYIEGRRRTAAAERFCAIALLRRLHRIKGHFFPASLARAEAGMSPDFVLSATQGGLRVAVEHTDAGEEDYRRWERTIGSSPGVHHVPSPGGGGWVGDEPEQAYATALRRAVASKSANDHWRGLPSAPRWLLVGDRTNTGWHVEWQTAQEIAADVFREIAWPAGLTLVALVRGQDKIAVLTRGGDIW